LEIGLERTERRGFLQLKKTQTLQNPEIDSLHMGEYPEDDGESSFGCRPTFISLLANDLK